tara:strand:+ start:294 stop:515 length:222 start_codon:yes stop_codon:yes gene_type:complete
MDLFTLYWFDASGERHVEIERCSFDEKFKSALARLTQGPAACMGMVKRVQVVDMFDCTSFLWKDGNLIYPVLP